MSIKTELMTKLTVAMIAIIAGASPHSPIIVLMKSNKNIEFKIKTPIFMLKLLTIKLVQDTKHALNKKPFSFFRTNPS
jgi:hypothetical protein